MKTDATYYTTFIMDVMAAIARFDLFGDVIWTDFSDGTELPKFYVITNDVIGQACADAEEITPDNLDILIESCEQMSILDGIPFYGPYLFVARVRNQMPLDEFFDSSRKQDLKIKKFFEKSLASAKESATM
jgi:hypothetical protein